MPGFRDLWRQSAQGIISKRNNPRNSERGGGCERGREGNTFITLKTKKSLDDHYICHHLLFKKLIEKVDAKILSCCMLKIIYNMHKH